MSGGVIRIRAPRPAVRLRAPARGAVLLDRPGVAEHIVAALGAPGPQGPPGPPIDIFTLPLAP